MGKNREQRGKELNCHADLFHFFFAFLIPFFNFFRKKCCCYFFQKYQCGTTGVALRSTTYLGLIKKLPVPVLVRYGTLALG